MFEVSGEEESMPHTQLFFIPALGTTYSTLLHVRSKGFYTDCIAVLYTCLTGNKRLRWDDHGLEVRVSLLHNDLVLYP